MKCSRCEEELTWSNCFSYEDYGILNKEGTIDLYNCLECGLEVEIYSEDKIVGILEFE